MIAKKILLSLNASLLVLTCFAQQEEFKHSNNSFDISKPIEEVVITSISPTINFDTTQLKLNFKDELVLNVSKNRYSCDNNVKDLTTAPLGLMIADNSLNQTNLLFTNKNELTVNSSLLKSEYSKLNLNSSTQENEPFLRNRRNVYSSVWAFASLNYLYADLVGVMDKNKLLQYQTGVVEGVKITPEFLTIAAGFMQIPIANVFLPHIIKNEKTLRWVQIASGTIMTLVQSGTLLVGKPTPYYALFSAFEIAATTYITIDAIKWKAKSNKRN